MKSLPLDCCVCLRRIDFRDGIRAIPGAPGARVCSWACMEKVTKNLRSDSDAQAEAIAMLTATVAEQRNFAERALNLIAFDNDDDTATLYMVRDHLQMIAQPTMMLPPRPTALTWIGGG